MKITDEEWYVAQRQEYNHYLSLTDRGIPTNTDFQKRVIIPSMKILGEDYRHKSVTEIGGGLFSLLPLVDAREKVYIDPIQLSYDAKVFYNLQKIKIFDYKVEEIIGYYGKPTYLADELWTTEFIQHTQDPIYIYKNLYKIGRVLRFCEACNTPKTFWHPHSFGVNELKELLISISSEQEFWMADYDFPYLCGIVKLKETV